MINRKYGVVYTPESLAEFTAQLIAGAAKEHGKTIKTVLDPACGECALLSSAKVRFGESVEYWGIDVDADAVQNAQEGFHIIHNDSIMPQKVKRSTSEYWKSKLPPIDAIIANPPWSTEKIYDRTALSHAGFSLVNGQYDSYVLFLELSYNLLVPEGIMAFIIPDSLFDTAFQRRWRMRLIENSFENVRPSLANCPILDTEVTWRHFCETINKQIVGNKAKMASSEDKRLGVYFVHESDLKHNDSDILPAGGWRYGYH